MAATISINFTTPEEVFSVDPPTKKSVSAKVLADVLGGGVVGGGYVRRTGDSMTGLLSLTSAPPTAPTHAVPKYYVDERAFTRRYYYTVGTSITPGTIDVFGRDDNSNVLIFFNNGDDPSIDSIYKYVDVYRNGILQVFNQDYSLESVYQDQSIVDGQGNPLFPHTVRFFSPLLSATNVQVHVGSVGAMPTITGVASVTAFPNTGIEVRNYTVNRELMTGDLALNVNTLHFIASANQVADPKRNDLVLSPMNLSAFPLVPKAFAHYRKSPGYLRELFTDRYGDTNGYFRFIKGYNLGGLRSGVGTDPVDTFTCVISSGVFVVPSAPGNYAPNINISVANASNKDQYAVGVILNDTKLATSFKFSVFDFFYGAPEDVDEVTITVF